MSSTLKIHFTKNYNKTEKLAFLKERYKKLILDPRKEIETEIEKDLTEEGSIGTPSVDSLCQ
ncbi:MAG: hypothetical protein HON76_05845 [Candidatus Scalindua sp.]|jgi:hypothetical protein|nr:hypothetical protein [Candidatus Scalindua sp.]MBT5306596.1 hypothetical protein [Candidatus Scalindua sp.]MBT6048604.1 hypothetical protein [Candidatus Scalindua sp.]MBT6226393.1 hypothetical protein [Candidatus Scalindua sp.]MBT6562032.1 hypothetical protein [Candidatus Scalindua sp.]